MNLKMQIGIGFIDHANGKWQIRKYHTSSLKKARSMHEKDLFCEKLSSLAPGELMPLLSDKQKEFIIHQERIKKAASDIMKYCRDQLQEYIDKTDRYVSREEICFEAAEKYDDDPDTSISYWDNLEAVLDDVLKERN